MADINAICEQFTDYYYNAFDNDRPSLAPLYRDHSMLTWEKEQILGAQAIMEKLVNLPFKKVGHLIVTRDAQPASATEPSMFVLVTGQIKTDDDQGILQFSQFFHLVPEAGSYYIQNDIFRLVYG